MGSTYGQRVRFDIDDNTFIGGDGIRKGLPGTHQECLIFWKPILRVAVEHGLVTFYTDVGKDKINNRAMVNIIAGLTFPGLPMIPFDLVLATIEFNSLMLSMAESDEDKDKVNPEELANEVFSKNGENIRNSFEHLLKTTYELEPEHYYVVADRASENIAGFGRRYLCCAGHQYDNSFK